MNRSILIIALTLISICTTAQKKQLVSIIPQPVSIETGNGVFNVNAGTSIEINSNDKSLQRIAALLAERLTVPTGFPVKVKQVSNFSTGNIQLILSGKAASNNEAYILKSTPEQVTITADSAAGIFYGIQTLLQLLPKEI